MSLRWADRVEVGARYLPAGNWEGHPVLVHRALWPVLREGTLRLTVHGLGPFRRLAVEADKRLQRHLAQLLADWEVG